MYGRFADAELLGGGTDGRPIFDDVHSQITGSLFDVLPHVSNPLSCASNTGYARSRGNISQQEIKSAPAHKAETLPL